MKATKIIARTPRGPSCRVVPTETVLAAPQRPAEIGENVRRILRVVEVVTDVQWGRMASVERHPSTVTARRLMAHLLRKRTTLSFPQIALIMGRKRGGHATIVEQAQYVGRNVENLSALISQCEMMIDSGS